MLAELSIRLFALKLEVFRASLVLFRHAFLQRAASLARARIGSFKVRGTYLCCHRSTYSTVCNWLKAFRTNEPLFRGRGGHGFQSHKPPRQGAQPNPTCGIHVGTAGRALLSQASCLVPPPAMDREKIPRSRGQVTWRYLASTPATSTS